MRYHSIRTFLAICELALVLVLGTSCQEPPYRIEVQPGQQGQTELRRIPLTPEEQATRERAQELAKNAAVARDPELTELQLLWSKLSEKNRTELLEQARRMTQK